jgi:hypothetical protein
MDQKAWDELGAWPVGLLSLPHRIGITAALLLSIQNYGIRQKQE